MPLLYVPVKIRLSGGALHSQLVGGAVWVRAIPPPTTVYLIGMTGEIFS